MPSSDPRPATERFRLSHATAQGQAGDTRARLLVVAAAVLFSTGGAAIKTEAFSALQVSSARSAVAAVVLWLAIGGRCRLDGPVLVGAAAYAATLTLFVTATRLTTAASAIALQATAPLYLLLIGPWLLGEPSGRRERGYVAAMMGGLLVCVLGQPAATRTAPDPAMGTLLAVLSGLGWAVTLVALRRAATSATPGSPLSTVVVGNALAAVVVLPWALPYPPASLVSWTGLLYLGAVQIALAYVCLTRAVGRLPALEVSLLLLLEPVLNPVWTWFVRGESPGGWVVAGGALVLAASVHRVITGPART